MNTIPIESWLNGMVLMSGIVSEDRIVHEEDLGFMYVVHIKGVKKIVPHNHMIIFRSSIEDLFGLVNPNEFSYITIKVPHYFFN
jgi:hypothetical protein